MADEADVHEPRAHATPHESAPRRSTGMPHLLSSLPRVLTHLRPAAGFDWRFQPLRFALRVLARLWALAEEAAAVVGPAQTLDLVDAQGLEVVVVRQLGPLGDVFLRYNCDACF